MRQLALLLILAAGVPAAAQMRTLDEAGYPKLVASAGGKVLLVNFWATWCVPCRKEMPALAELEKRLSPRGFELVTVSADEPEQQEQAVAFLKKYGVAPPYYLRKAKDDDKFINLVDPKWSGALPALILYDRQGKKVRAFFGETELKTVEAAIAKLL